jgi:hypothetical protein
MQVIRLNFRKSMMKKTPVNQIQKLYFSFHIR